MAYIITREQGHHNWEKQNLVTVMTRSGHHDLYECAGCGMKAKSDSLTTIKIPARYSKARVMLCKAYVKPELTNDIYVVEISPWPNRLPVGTEILECEPREGAGNWFKRKDGNLLFEGEPDGKFCLLSNEFSKKK